MTNLETKKKDQKNVYKIINKQVKENHLMERDFHKIC